jgi:hypothetical protein
MKASVAVLLCAGIACISAQTHLRADGSSNTYGMLESFLGGNSLELPDCAHNVPHIFQGNDGMLNKQVFFFDSHLAQDNDRCMNYDRQRIEITTYQSQLYGGHGETVSNSWNFKLDAAFQPSTAFTHLHQLKAVGGNDKLPIITLTARKANPNKLQVIHIDNGGTTTYLGETSLSPFLGNWVHVVQDVTHWTGGGYYKVVFTNLLTGAHIYTLEKSNVEMWRGDNSFVRPKWGIYRSLTDQGSLRDERVRFDDFCFAKGNSKCY